MNLFNYDVMSLTMLKNCYNETVNYQDKVRLMDWCLYDKKEVHNMFKYINADIITIRENILKRLKK